MASLPFTLTAALVGLVVQVASVDGAVPQENRADTDVAFRSRVPDVQHHADFSDALEASLNDGNWSQQHYDQCGYQLEARHSQEIEGNKTFDDEYNSQFIESIRDVAVLPSVDEIRGMLKTKHIDFGDDFDFPGLSRRNPWVNSLLSAQSCPRTQNYGCRSVYWTMPSFKLFNGESFKYCCPVFPQDIIRIAHCNCCKCAQLSQMGAQCGDCTRRYRWQRIVAFCTKDGKFDQWDLVYQWKYIPTSCYCKTH